MKRGRATLTLDGLFDGAVPPSPCAEMKDLLAAGKPIILRLKDVSLLGWHVYPVEHHVKGKMTRYEWGEASEWSGSVLVDSIERRRAPWARWAAWHLAGRFVWWWRSRRGEEVTSEVDEV